MKIIDLYNKIANGEELPKKIKYEDRTYTLYLDEEKNHYYQDDKCKYFMLSISCLEALNEEVEIIEENKTITIDGLNLSLQEIEAFQEARQIFLKLNNEEDKKTFVKLLLGEGTYERWKYYLKSKGDEENE